jgi:uncharacterized protein YdeI (YjbR/CyaY-like superfamily)
MKISNRVYVTDRDQWRKWLEKNHEIKNEVWLLYYKKHAGKPQVPYNDSVEEAICFGWIDSIVKRIDDEKYVRRFTPRKNTSNWSESNKKRAKKMIEEKKMTEAGLKKMNFQNRESESSKEEKLVIPSYMRKAFAAGDVWENFCNLALTYKKQYVGWIASAKREKTREKRLEEALRLLKENKKLPLK